MAKAAVSAKGDAKTVLDGIVTTIGKKDDGNGVVIKNTSKGSGSWRGLAKGGILKINFGSLNNAASGLGQKGQDFMVASTTTHEGWHGWWEKLTRAAGTYEEYGRSFATANETRAGISEGILAQSLGLDHPQGFWTREGGFDMQKIEDQAADSVSEYCRLGCGE